MAAALRVLVVEGDPLARAGMEYFLRRGGFQPSGAGTLKEALDAIDQVDVVFLEMDLSDGNGVDLLRHIKDKQLPIRAAIITGNPQSATQARSAGSDACFEKPISRGKLDAMLAWLKSLPPNASTP